jgi:hypothetical protein
MCRPCQSVCPLVSNQPSETKQFVGLQINFGTGFIYKKLSSKPEFRENRLGDSHTLLISPPENLNPYSSLILVQLG